MPLNKCKGEMYDWITHTHTHLAGKCPHECSYCSVQDMANHYPVLKEKYSGRLRLIEKEFAVNYGAGKTIFVENCNDLFAAEVPDDFISKIISHCNRYPRNTYIFQTKNPDRFSSWLHVMPPNHMLGCTIETNYTLRRISRAPNPIERFEAMASLEGRKFITIEPILLFSVDILFEWICRINPEFVHIGADSKNHRLPEPIIEQIMELEWRISLAGIDVKEKRNLARLRR